MPYNSATVHLPPDPLCIDTAVRKGTKRNKSPDRYYHLPQFYLSYAMGKGLTAAALALLVEAHRYVMVGFGPLPLSLEKTKPLGMSRRELRTAREQLQRMNCAQWNVYQEGPRKCHMLAVDPNTWTDRS